MNRRCHMKDRCLVLFGVVAAVVAVASVPMAGQAGRVTGSTAAPTKSWTHPRTAWGDPDLQGTYRPLTQVPFERAKGAAEFRTDAEVAKLQREADERFARVAAGAVDVVAERGLPLRNGIWYSSGDRVRISRRTSAIVDPPSGRVPAWTPQQVKRWEAREAAKIGRVGDSWEDRSHVERCFGVLDEIDLGFYGLIRPPRETARVKKDEFDLSTSTREVIPIGAASAGDTGYRFVQAPGYVVIVRENTHQGEYQIIPVDRRPALGPKIRQYKGDSRGHWEGNTLVVEITHVNDQQDGGRFIPNQETALYPGSGETLRVIERYTRVDADTLEVRYTVDDPETFIRPFTVLREWTRDDHFAMAPGICHENNDGIAGIIAGHRADKQWALDYQKAQALNRQRRLEELKAEWAESKDSR